MASLVSNANQRFIYIRAKSRKTCPSCYRKISDKRVWAISEFVQEAGRWADLIIFCEGCYQKVALQRIQLEARGKQYRVVYVAIGGTTLPHWLTYHPGEDTVRV